MKRFLIMFLLTVPLARGQDEERIGKLFQDAVQVMGGDAYLKVTDIVTEGNYFLSNKEGDSSGLIKYNDYTKLPNKSRNELGNKKKQRDITVFNLDKEEGWILEGQKDTRTATPEEIKDFKKAVKHSIETIFRFRYKDPANKLFYLGAGEGLDVRLDVVRLLDPENDETTIYFDRISKLPAKVESTAVDKRGVKIREVQEFSQWHVIQGVNTPLRVDGFVNGHKASQLFVTKITYNNNLPDSFFAKPEPPK